MIGGSLIVIERCLNVPLNVLKSLAEAAVGRRFLELLVDGDESECPRVTSALPWGDTRPLYFLNVGVTAEGLQALGVLEAMHMVRKGQLDCPGDQASSSASQFYSLAC